MGSKWLRIIVASVLCAFGVAAPASAQFEDKTCISLNPLSGHLIEQAAHDLDFKENIAHGDEMQFIAGLKSKQWDLIGLELAASFLKIQNKAEILDLFKQQHAGGAKIIVCYAHLDEWPELQEFMGLEGAVDVGPFVLDVAPSMPGNPIWYENDFGDPAGFPVWSDHGDYLKPTPDSIVVTVFEDGGIAATMTADRTRIVNGWNFDEYQSPGSEIDDMIYYLMGCSADINRDAKLDLDDFLQFQSRFVQGDGWSNYDFDDSLTVFDFLEFFNQFVFGCPH